MSHFKKFRVTVTMKKPWTTKDSWYAKPTKNNILERLQEELENGNLDELFEITVEEVEGEKNECT